MSENLHVPQWQGWVRSGDRECNYLETRTNGHGNADMEDADMEDADIKKITLETLKYLIT